MKKEDSAQLIWDELVAADAAGELRTTEEIIEATGLTRSQFQHGWAEVKDAALQKYKRTLGQVWMDRQCYWKLPTVYGDSATPGTTKHRLSFRLRSNLTAVKRTYNECIAGDQQYDTLATRRMMRDVERVVEDLVDVNM